MFGAPPVREVKLLQSSATEARCPVADGMNA